MKKSAELREQKLLVIEQMKKLHQTAEKEDRAFNDAEESRYNDLKGQTMEFDKRIAVALEREAQELEIIQSRAVSISDKERRQLSQYSVLKAIQGQMKGGLDGLEKEMHDEAVREARNSGTNIQGIGIPLLIIRGGLEKRTDYPQNVATDTYGQELVPTMKPRLIDGLWPDTVVESLGATVFRGLSGSLSLPRNTAGLSAAWETENADANNTAATFDEVAFTPNRMAAFVQISKQLLLQSSVDIEAWIKREIARAVAIKLETDIINGTTPIDGLLGLSGATNVPHGATGGAPTWATMVAFEGNVAVNNALKGRLGYLTNHKVRAKLKTVSKDSGSGQFIWEPGNTINGYPVGITSLMPSNLEKSTSGTVLSGMIFGNWEDYGIAQWGGYDIIVDPYTKAKNALVEVVINSYWDAKPLQVKSFSQSMDIAT